MEFYSKKAVSFAGTEYYRTGVGESNAKKLISFAPVWANHINMSSKGIRYNRLSDNGLQKSDGQAAPDAAMPNVRMVEVEREDGLAFKKVESGDVSFITDEALQDQLQELNQKRKRIAFWPFVLALAILFIGIFSIWGLVAAFLVYLLVDRVRKTTVLFYDIGEATEEKVKRLYDAFMNMTSSKKVWNVEALADNVYANGNSGARQVVRRTEIEVKMKSPPYCKTNVKVLCIPAGKQTLYFFPDKVLVYEKKKVGGLSYQMLEVYHQDVCFVEEGKQAPDSQIVEYAWKYTTKSGARDQRYSVNPQFPLLLHSELSFVSENGLYERILFSKSGAGAEFLAQLEEHKKDGILAIRKK